MPEDPEWPRASQWLTTQRPDQTSIALAVCGFPLNESITPGHCDLAPQAIRQALERFSTYDVDLEVDLNDLTVRDFGDVSLMSAAATLHAAVGASTCALLLGGDNGITRTGVHSLGVPLSECGLLTFDAHHDVRSTADGPHNGNPVRGLLEDGLPGDNIVQIGIQPFTNSKAYSEFARASGITIVTVDEVRSQGIELVVARALRHLADTRAVYVDLDMDVLDRASAPACPGSRPGGLPPWMMRQAARLCGKAPVVKMMDIVEVDPTRDIADTTVLAAASFLLAFASGLAARLRI
jgi:formiminoglutamase